MKLISAELILPIIGSPIKQGAVLIRDKKIAELGSRKELKRKYPQVKEFHYSLLMPSLINAHCHLELSGIGLIRSKDFVSWLIQLIKEKKAQDLLKVEQNALKEIAQSLKQGITSFGDIISERVMFRVHQVSSSFSTLFWELIGMREVEIEEKLKNVKTIFGGFNYQLGEHKLGLSPHSPYTVHKEFFRVVKKFAQGHKLCLCTHLAESKPELELIKTGGGEIFTQLYPAVNWQEIKPEANWVSPVQYLSEIIDDNLSLVHCVEVNDEEIEIIRKARAVIHCPRSNLNLLGKLEPVPKMLKAKIPVGLGTDSSASAGDFNLWEEMKKVLELRDQYPGGKVQEFDILKMATINSARAIFREKEVGSIEPGKLANLLGLNISPLPKELEEICSFLIESGERAVSGVFLGGERIN